MARMIRRKRVALGAAVAVVALGALVLASSSQAVRVLQGKIVVVFEGTISPSKLPRTGTAPVGVQMGGKIKTTDGTAPPKLNRIILDINRNGKLQTKGLATCSLGQLRSISSEGAKRACSDALVGSGSVTSRVSLPDQGAFASVGKLLAFNGVNHGHSAIFAQVASGAPLPLTYVIVFDVKNKGGTFGTSLVGTMPPIASEYGFISAFNLLLRRQYSFHGEKMSYASAACPAPEGFTAANFAFAKVSYQFADGSNLSSKLVRQCKVKG
jgi:hypothetical protein